MKELTTRLNQLCGVTKPTKTNTFKTSTMDKFIKDLKKNKSHILKTIKTYDGKSMIYYREYGSYSTDVKTKVFNN